MAVRKKLVWSLAAAVVIVAVIVVATGSLDAPRFQVLRLDHNPVIVFTTRSNP